VLREVAQAMFADRFDSNDGHAPVAPAQGYAQMLAPLGEVSVWGTDYIQRLAPVETGHPVHHFTQPTIMRPFAEKLNAAEMECFIASYEDALNGHYPSQKDGSVLFSFERVFIRLMV